MAGGDGVSGAAVVVGGRGIAFPAAATVLFPIAFTLLAAAAAIVLDEPASRVVDVTPTGPVRRTTIRAVASLALPWAAAGIALAGDVLLGFAAECVVRTRTGEPGAATGTAVVPILMAPSLLPPMARRVSTFPAPGATGQSSDPVCWTVLAVCVAAVALSVNSRPLPRWLGGLSLTTYAVFSGAVGAGIIMGRDLTS